MSKFFFLYDPDTGKGGSGNETETIEDLRAKNLDLVSKLNASIAKISKLQEDNEKFYHMALSAKDGTTPLDDIKKNVPTDEETEEEKKDREENENNAKLLLSELKKERH
jgi:hypothetical protein